MKKTTKFTFMAMAISVCTLFTACQPADVAEVTDALPAIGSDELSAAEGDWTCILSKSIDASDFETTTFLEDSGENFTAKVYKEDGKEKIDISDFGATDYTLEIYGRELELVKEAFDDACENQEWYATFWEKETDYNTRTFYLTMPDEDTLELILKSSYQYEDGSVYDYTDYYYFKKSDSDLEAAIDAYRYPETITVSNAKELYNAIGSNRRIILKEGTYNFSELSESDKDTSNEAVNWRYTEYPYDEDDGVLELEYYPADQAYCYSVSNLIIEGEEGADVHICTEDVIVAPLAFWACDHIKLKNLKIGHLAEPGICAGSVTYFYSCTNVDIDDCRLYGCGTYGVETQGSSYFNITNCDIYECSYGLLALRSSYEMEVSDCTLRDSKDCSAFDFMESNDISIDNCSITGNETIETDAFVSAINNWGNIKFNNCTFKDNKYDQLCDVEDVEFNNCTMD